MRGWRRGPGDEALATSPDTPLEGPIAGDRGIPSLEGARSVQSRVSAVLSSVLPCENEKPVFHSTQALGHAWCCACTAPSS